MEEILKKISELVAEGEEEDAVEAVKEAIAMGIDPLVILNEGAAKGMDIVGEQYSAARLICRSWFWPATPCRPLSPLSLKIWTRRRPRSPRSAPS